MGPEKRTRFCLSLIKNPKFNCLSSNQFNTVLPGGAAYRAGGVELGEHESFGCHLVKVGGGGGRVAIAG